MGNRIRVCFVSLMFSPIIGGVQVQMERQAHQLQALGHEITVVTLRNHKSWRKTEVLDGLHIVRVGGLYNPEGILRNGRLGHLPIDLAMLFTLWRLRQAYDVIHVFQATHLSAVAALIGKILRKPVIISIRNTGPDNSQRKQLEKNGAMLMADTLTGASYLKVDFKEWAPGEGDISYLPRSGLVGPAMLRFLRESDAFYHILSTRSRSYLTTHGFRAEQIVLIPNGVETEKFRPGIVGHPDPAKPERIITCVARLEHSKGVDVLLHAWGRMMHTPTEWRAHLKPLLWLAGDGIFRPQMERIVLELGIKDSVEFLGERRDIIELLHQSWGFVLPSRWEGMPNALLEAMACGLPCVATRVSGSEDIIFDNVNGFLVEPEHPAQLAQALRCIIEDVACAQRLGQEGRITVVQKYQLINVVEQGLALYRHLIKDDTDTSLALERESNNG